MSRLLTALAGALAIAGVSAAQPVAVTGGRVVTNTDVGVIENGVVVFDQGRITAVGAAGEVTPPRGARVIDASGQWVTPGLFAPFTRLGLIEVGLENDANDSVAALATYSASLSAADAFNPRATAIDATRMEGVTRIAVAPSAGLTIFAGRGALADTSGSFDSITDDAAFMHVVLDQGGAFIAGGSRAASWAFLDAAMEDARSYPGRFAATREGDALNRYDAAALVPVARGEMPLLAEVDRAADILAAIRFQERNPEIRMILVGAGEAGAVADELAEAGIPVMVDPLRNLPSSFDIIGASREIASTLSEAGVLFAITPLSAGGGDYFNVRLLPQHAGNAVAYGLDWQSAFEAVSLNPARIYGVDDELGALGVGMIADVVIWDGDPLEVMTAPTAVFIDGVETSLMSRQTALRDRYLPREELNETRPAWRPR